MLLSVRWVRVLQPSQESEFQTGQTRQPTCLFFLSHVSKRYRWTRRRCLIARKPRRETLLPRREAVAKIKRCQRQSRNAPLASVRRREVVYSA